MTHLPRWLRYLLADIFTAIADVAARIDERLADACNDPKDQT